MKYRPDIDGLRALAILFVVIYHADLWLKGGFVGVDVFFVISGYLITRNINDSIRRGNFSYRVFWQRRVKRLVPALCFVTILTGLAAPYVLIPADLQDFGGALLAQPFMLANVYFWRVVKGGYFGDYPEQRPLLHTWSLAVEEQFYLALPVLLVLISSKLRGRGALSILSCLAIGSFALGVVLTSSKPVLAFFLLPTRAWELLLGCLAAEMPKPKWNPATASAVGWFGLLLLLVSAFGFSGSLAFPGSLAIIPCLGTALIIYANTSGHQTSLMLVLSQPKLLHIGKASYSIYLWHWPLFSLIGYLGLLQTPITRVGLALSCLILGHVSCRYIENPFRERDWLGTPISALRFYGIYTALCVGLGSHYIYSKGLPENWPAKSLTYATATEDRAIEFESKLDGRVRKIGSAAKHPTFVIWGDSHALAHVPVLNKMAKERGLAGIQHTKSATPPILGWPLSGTSREDWDDEMLRQTQDKSVKVVFMAARWDKYRSERNFESLFNKTVSTLQQRGVMVVVVLDVDYQTYNVPRTLALEERYDWYKNSRPRTSRERWRSANQRIRNCGAKNVVYLNPEEFIATSDEALEQIEGVALYRNAGHLSSSGSMFLAPMFAPIFDQMASDKSGASEEPARQAQKTKDT